MIERLRPWRPFWHRKVSLFQPSTCYPPHLRQDNGERKRSQTESNSQPDRNDKRDNTKRGLAVFEQRNERIFFIAFFLILISIYNRDGFPASIPDLTEEAGFEPAVGFWNQRGQGLWRASGGPDGEYERFLYYDQLVMNVLIVISHVINYI